MKKLLTFSFLVILCTICIGFYKPTNVEAKVKLNKSNASVTVGFSTKLKVKGSKKPVKWKSANKNIATVSKTGKVIGIKAGKTTIKAVIGKKVLKSKITVMNNVFIGSRHFEVSNYGVGIHPFKAYYKRNGSLVIKGQCYNNTPYYVTDFEK